MGQLTVQTMKPGDKGYVSPQALRVDNDVCRVDGHVPVQTTRRTRFMEIERTRHGVLVYLKTIPENTYYSTGCQCRPQSWDLPVRLM